MAGPSSTISLISIVDVGIVNDIVGEIVTCGRVFRVKLVRPCQLQRIICSICAVICEPGGEPAQAAYLCPGGAHTAYLYCNLLRGTLDGRPDRVCDENLTTQRNLYHSAVAHKGGVA